MKRVPRAVIVVVALVAVQGAAVLAYRHIQADYYGHVSELLAKAVRKSALDDVLTKEDGEILLESLRSWGALDKDMRYVKGAASSGRRGWEKNPGGGLTARVQLPI